MLASVKLYKETAFNPVNLPFDLEALEARASSTVDVGTVDINQVYGLSMLRIPATEETVMSADYMRLTPESGAYGPAYYVITGYYMTSSDTASLSLSPDPFMSLGGISEIGYKAGRVKRYTFAPEDNGNLLCDPFFIPQRQPDIVFDTLYKYEGNNMEFWDIVLSTVKLESINLETINEMYKAVENSDKTISYTVTNEPDTVEYGTSYTMRIPVFSGSNIQTGMLTVYQRGVQGYRYDFATTRDGLKKLNILGRANAIIGGYRIPRQMVELSMNSNRVNSVSAKGPTIEFDQSYVSRSVPYPNGWEDFSDEEKFILQHYEGFRCGIQSLLSGDSYEMQFTKAWGKVYFMIDPSPDGTIYACLPPNMAGSSDTQDPQGKEFMLYLMERYGIKGGPWPRINILADGTAGIYPAMLQQQAAQKFGDWDAQRGIGRTRIQNAVADTQTALGALASIPGTTASAHMSQGGFGHAITGAGFGGGLSSSRGYGLSQSVGSNDYLGMLPNFVGRMGADILADYDANTIMQQRAHAKNMERAALNVEAASAIPTQVQLAFPSLGDYVGNPVMIYTMWPQQSDMKRFVDIWRKYGMVCDIDAAGQTPVRSDFGYWQYPATKDCKCCYMEISGANAYTEGNAPLELLRDVNASLAGGIRFWIE